MPPQRHLAHLSDLHLGRDRRTEENAARVVDAFVTEGVETVLVTGDVTHRGRAPELALFEAIFAPLRDRVVVVPGNHDRLGEDAGRHLMSGVRVAAEARPGLHVVRLDSTASHNRALLSCHGALSEGDVTAVDAAISAAPPDTLVTLMLHHHLLPLAEDHFTERLASWLGLPNAAELPLGRCLLERLRGRCDLVVHGHRHAASALVLPARAGRTLHVLNAGSTTEHARFAVLSHARGRIETERWVDASARSLGGRSGATLRRREGGQLAAA
jgi:3',5'-cyclic AMP phosphodiesterase CpdA